jgi:hypothetical protein
MCKWLKNYNPFVWYENNESDDDIEKRIVAGESRHLLEGGEGSARELVEKMIKLKPEDRLTVSLSVLLTVFNPGNPLTPSNPMSRQIPEVLAHPFLNPKNTASSRELQNPVFPALSQQPIDNPDPDILNELLFLASCANEWFPVQSDWKIRERLKRPEKMAQWEKMVYNGLAAWKAKDPDLTGSVGPSGLIGESERRWSRRNVPW